MLEGLSTFFKKIFKSEKVESEKSKDAAKERLHLVLMQDRANVSADFLDLMKQEIIEVIKKYIVVDEKEIDVRLTNQSNEDGTNGAPALYANIPIINIKNDVKSAKMKETLAVNKEEKVVEKQEDVNNEGSTTSEVSEVEVTENVEDKEEIDDEAEKEESQDVIETEENVTPDVSEDTTNQENSEDNKDSEDKDNENNKNDESSKE